MVTLPAHPGLLEVSSWHGMVDSPPPLPEAGCPAIDPRRRIDLRMRTHTVYAWIWRYVELYKAAPCTRDVAIGVDMPRISTADALCDLADDGRIVLVGDGWVPVEAP